MFCKHCQSKVQKDLENLIGVKSVVVDLENKKATLIHNGSVAVKTAIETIESAGYSAKLID